MNIRVYHRTARRGMPCTAGIGVVKVEVLFSGSGEIPKSFT